MKFVTLANGTPDGRLHVASRDGHRAVAAENAETLQQALETWAENATVWQAQYDRLNAGETADAQPFSADAMLAPLPRAWQWLDGSAFETHSLLIQKAWGQPEVGLNERPLMYQGMSDRFYGPSEDVALPATEHGIDFEGEFAVVTDDVPMGCPANEAMQHIRLILLLNDWSLRAIAPVEMKTGFGWVQAKPACSMAPAHRC